MRKEYDFSRGIRGKYARRYAEGTNIVVLDPDLARLFPDSKSVNDALRVLASLTTGKEGKIRIRQSRPSERKRSYKLQRTVRHAAAEAHASLKNATLASRHWESEASRVMPAA